MYLLKRLKKDLLNSKNLSELSPKLHLVIIFVLLTQNIPIAIYRYFHFPIVITHINIIEISIYIVAVAFYFSNKFQISILTTALGIPILFSYFTFIQPITTIENTFNLSFWFLICFMLIYIIIIRENKFRLAYVVFVFAIYFIPGSILAYNYPGNLIKLIQFSTLTLIPLLISSFIENQDSRIINLNQSLEKRLQEKANLSKKVNEKNKELITFSHIMSHDLKSPIRTINSFTQLLKRKITFKDKKNEEYFQYIEDSSKSMKILIDDLMTYYKIDAEENQSEITDLNLLLNEIKLNHQFELNNKRLKFDFEHLPEIDGYKNLLRTLFHNLISNSIKYQPKDILYHVPSIKIYPEENDKFNNIYVSDNGIGIDKNYVTKLFMPFQKFHKPEDYEGTGLGMSICKRVMDKHGGEISVLATSEKGTTIKLGFPKS